MSRRLALIAFVIALGAGVAGITVRATDTDTTLKATLATFPVQLMAILQERGDRVCQQPVALTSGVDRVRLVVAPANEVRGPVRIELRQLADDEAGSVIAAGTLPRGRLTGAPTDVDLSPALPDETTVAVCVTLGGGAPLEVWGQPTGPATPATSMAVQDGEPLEPDGDLYLEFPRGEPTSTLSQVPAALRNAAPFKLGGMGAWVFWVLGGALLLASLSLARALGRASAHEP